LARVIANENARDWGRWQVAGAVRLAKKEQARETCRKQCNFSMFHPLSGFPQLSAPMKLRLFL
jgi:hypothetical protein